jgi:hypothetical protein
MNDIMRDGGFRFVAIASAAVAGGVAFRHEQKMLLARNRSEICALRTATG